MSSKFLGFIRLEARESFLSEFGLLRWFLVFWVGCILVWGLVLPSGARPSFPGSSAVLAILMIIHAAIYWIILSPGIPKRLVAALLILQGILLIAISLVALHMVVSMCLYLTLAGVVIVSVNQIRHALLAALLFLIGGIPGYVFYSRYIGIGTVIWFFMPIALFLFIAFMIFAQQVSAKNHTQQLLAELAESHRQLEAYSAQIEQLTLSNERQRMARELHDTLAQGLAGIILQLEAVDSHLGSGRAERAQSIVRQAMVRARATLAESRQVIDRLRTNTAPTPNELPRLIRDEAERFSNATGIPVTIQNDPGAALPVAQGDCVLRAVTEALLNVGRYANASQVWISLVVPGDHLQLEIRDNGSGFDPASRIGQTGHYGLLGLRERARLLGGTLEVQSSSQQGTCLTLWLPVETEVSHDG